MWPLIRISFPRTSKHIKFPQAQKQAILKKKRTKNSFSTASQEVLPRCDIVVTVSRLSEEEEKKVKHEQ